LLCRKPSRTLRDQPRMVPRVSKRQLAAVLEPKECQQRTSAESQAKRQCSEDCYYSVKFAKDGLYVHCELHEAAGLFCDEYFITQRVGAQETRTLRDTQIPTDGQTFPNRG